MTQTHPAKAALQAAMRELMTQQPFVRIRVEQICARANASRKTFYHYFLDKYDLVRSIFLEDFGEILSGVYEGWEFFQSVCTIFYENREFYLAAFEMEGQNAFSDTFSEEIYPLALDYFRRLFVQDSFNDFYAHFFTDSFRHSLVRWMRDYPEITPEQYVRRLQVAVMGVARNFSPDSLDLALMEAEQEDPEWIALEI